MHLLWYTFTLFIKKYFFFKKNTLLLLHKRAPFVIWLQKFSCLFCNFFYRCSSILSEPEKRHIGKCTILYHHRTKKEIKEPKVLRDHPFFECSKKLYERGQWCRITSQTWNYTLGWLLRINVCLRLENLCNTQTRPPPHKRYFLRSYTCSASYFGRTLASLYSTVIVTCI